MGLENVKYDAFISYRHSELDKFNAMTIQKKLENFKLPKSLYGKTMNGKTKIERVFRDQDELPLASNLSDPIQTALENSEFLIVICTPRLPESQWCAKEIDTFIRLHGRERVLAVLAEGEPEQSFPEALRFVNKVVTDQNGETTVVREEIEPLAADTRGANPKERKKNIDDAVLRLAAPVFGLNYDDLKQRHKEQKTKRIITVASSIAAVFFAFAVVCMLLALRINSQKNIIEDQYNEIETKNHEIEASYKEIAAKNEEIIAQNEEITAQNEEITAQNDLITAQNEEISERYREEALKYAESMADASVELLADGRKEDAVYAVRNAMPEIKDSEDVPYSAAAERALYDVMGVYDHQNTMTPMNLYTLPASPVTMSASPDARYLVTEVFSEQLLVFDNKTGEQIAAVSTGSLKQDVEWTGDTSFVFIDSSGLYYYDIESAEKVLVSEKSDYLGIDPNGERIYSYEFENDENRNYLRAYSTGEKHKMLFEVQVNISEDNPYYLLCSRLISNTKGNLVALITCNFANDGSFSKSEYTISVVNVKKKELVLEEKLSMHLLSDAVLTDKSLILLTSVIDMDNFTKPMAILNSVNIKTGNPEWERKYTDSYYTEMEYVNDGEEKLILDAQGGLSIVSARNGSSLSTQTYDGMTAGSFLIPNSDYFLKMYFTREGEILVYNSLIDGIINYTANYLKNVSDRNVTLIEYKLGQFFYAYDNENYIACFRLLAQQNVKKETNVKALTGGGKGILNYSADYRYALDSFSEYADDGLTVHRHIIYDLKDGSEVCSFTDASGSAVFSPYEDNCLITYSNEITKYDYSGNQKATVKYSDYSSFPNLSADGKCIVFMNKLGNSLLVVSLDSLDELYRLEGIQSSDKLLVSGEAGKLAVLSDDGIRLYSYDGTEPVGFLPLYRKLISSAAISADGKYLFVNNTNASIDIYETDTLTKVNVIYDFVSSVKSAGYIDELEAYLVQTDNGQNHLLNREMECIADIPLCRDYDAAENCFVSFEAGSLLWKNYVSYEEMIKEADEFLKDYEPSDFIRERYHM